MMFFVSGCSSFCKHPLKAAHLATASGTEQYQYSGLPLPANGLIGSFVPWKARTGTGLVALFGSGKRTP